MPKKQYTKKTKKNKLKKTHNKNKLKKTHNKNKLKKTHNKNKSSKRQTKKYNKRNNKKGGVSLGTGSYGSAYAEPRLPCKDETLETVESLNEVSKIFRNNKYAKDEYYIMEYLSEYFKSEPDKIIQLHNYAVLPKRICDYNKDEIAKEPYNTAEWQYDKEKRYNPIHNGYKSDKIVIYDRGSNDLLIETSKVKNVTDMQDYFNKMKNIYNGIEFINQNGLLHGDIKLLNMVNITNPNTQTSIFKMIDVGDIKNIYHYTSNNLFLMTYNNFYFIRNPLTIYSILFTKNGDNTPNKLLFKDKTKDTYLQNIELTPEILVSIFKGEKEFHIDSLNHFGNIIERLKIVILSLYGPETQKSLLKKLINMYSQKIFYCGFNKKNYDTTTIYNREQLNTIFENDLLTTTKERLDTINDRLNSIETQDELIRFLYKKLDKYAYGISLLKALSYIAFNLYKKIEIMDDEELKYFKYEIKQTIEYAFELVSFV